MKIKFVILTCPKHHETRVKTIRKHWGKDQDITFLSDLTIEPDIIGYNNIPIGYHNVCYKYIEFFKAYTDNNSDWTFFTDDDTYVNIRNVTNLLKQMDYNSSICIGHLGRLNEDCTDKDGAHTGFPLDTISGNEAHLPLDYPGGGAGFILSKTAMNDIASYVKSKSTETLPKCGYSDVTIGFWLRNCNVKLLDLEGFWYTSPQNLNHSLTEINKSFTYHHILEENILLFNKNEN